METKFELLDHTADVKFRAYGSTLNELFENSALAFLFYASEKNDLKINPKTGKIIEVKGNDKESLLYNFLDELIYLIDSENFILSKIKVTLRGYNLKAELYGDKASNYAINQVKAATYSEMSITQSKKGWEAIFVLDI